MQAIKNFFNLYKFSTLRNKMNSFGVNLSYKIILLYIALSFGISFIGGTLLQLNVIGVLIITLVFILCIPTLLIYSYEYKYQRTRFNDITSYMERLIYSYQKSGKIYTALKDVRDVSNGAIRTTIDEVLNFIDNGNAKDNLYKEAFSIIENKYKCSRLETLHNYLVDVELNGGKSDKALDMLLDDIRSWALRTTDYKADRKNIRNKVIISIILALITCVAALFMVPSEYTSKMTTGSIYQIFTALVGSLYIILYDYVQKLLAQSYLDLEMDKNNDKIYERATKRIARFDKTKNMKKAIIFLVVAVGITVIAQILGYLLLAIPLDFILIAMAYQPFYLEKLDINRVEKELSKAFPIWIRNLTLQLQVNSVNISIQNSLKSCPVILRAEVEKLLKGIDEKPGDIQPFNDFCKNYNLPDIKMSINYLYYVANFGAEDMLEQLDYIIRQNDYMTINEEKIRNNDSLSMMSMLILAPMFISIMKLLIDMWSLFSVFSSFIVNSSTLGG